MNKSLTSLTILLFCACALMLSCNKNKTPAPTVEPIDTPSVIAPYTKTIVGAHIWRGVLEEHNHLGSYSLDSTYVVQDVAEIKMDDDSTLHFEKWYTNAPFKCSAFNDSEVVYENKVQGIALHYNYVAHTLLYEQHYAVPDYTRDMSATTQAEDVTAKWKYLMADIAGTRLWHGTKRYYPGTPPANDTIVSVPDVSEHFNALSDGTITSDLIERRYAIIVGADSALLVFHSNWYNPADNEFYRDALIYYFPVPDSIHVEFGSPLAYQPYYWYDTP